MNAVDKIAVASLVASRAWAGAHRPSLPLKRRTMKGIIGLQDHLLMEMAEDFGKNYTNPYEAEAAMAGFLAAPRQVKEKLDKATEVLKKISNLLTDGEAKNLAEDFLNT